MTDSGFDRTAANVQSRTGESSARQYRRLWQSQIPTLDDFLANQRELTPLELAAVVRIDLRERLRRGLEAGAAAYLQRFPSLAGENELAVDVIYAEYLAREELGERPELEQFQQRFPQLAATLADQIQLHHALAEQPTQYGSSESSIDQAVAQETIAPDVGVHKLEADYEILEELGRGGMGVVYRARQPSLNRMVALKMVRHTDLDNNELLARFRAEAEVVASLHHPHIVQVYDYGQHDGAPYLALELVDGGTLASRLDGTPWNPRRAADLVRRIARAVHFAHQRGVIHRDLKPTNVLIVNDGDPLELKIADFGLAKVFRDHSSSQTQTGALLGTPSYMAPEQAYGRASGLGPATDVYALGAILYELLCGRPPYRGETAIDTLQQLLLADPVPLHRLTPSVPHDLATICAKCLERDPARRYASALELSEDLDCFLSDRPIQARRSGSLERSWRWCRRNPALAAAMGTIATLLLAVSIVSTWYSARLSRQLEMTQQAERGQRLANDESRLRLWDAYLAEVAARNSSRQLGQRFEALEAIRRAQELLPTIGDSDERKRQLRSAAISSLALPDMRLAKRLSTDGRFVYAAALAPAVDRVAMYRDDRLLVLARLSDGAVIASVAQPPVAGQPVLSPDGSHLAFVSDNGTQVWKLTGTELVPAWQKSDALWLTFSPDGQHAMLSQPSAGVTLIDASNGEVVRKLDDVQAVGFGAFDARTAALAFCTAHDVRVVAWKTGRQLATFETVASHLAWHPDGADLATWGNHELTVWNLNSRRAMVKLSHPGIPHHVRFSSDGMRLVSCSLWDERLKLWDVGTGQKELEMQGFAGLAVATDAHGDIVLLERDLQGVNLWQVADGSECHTLPRTWFPPIGSPAAAAISPDGRLLAISGAGGLELWDLARRRRVATQASTECMAQFDRQGSLIVSSPEGIFRWPRRDRQRSSQDVLEATVVYFGPPQRLSSIGAPTSLATCNPNDVLVYQEADGWYVRTVGQRESLLRLQPPNDPRKAALSPDDRFAAIASWDMPGATVWETATGRRIADLPIGRHGVLEFSPDGRWLATTPGGVQLWNTSDWSHARDLQAQGTTPNGLGVSFTPDSRALAISQPDGTLRLVDPMTGRDWARFTHPARGPLPLVAFTPDATSMLTLPNDRFSQGRLWNLVEVRSSLRQLGLDWPAEVFAPTAPASARPGPIEVVWNDAGWELFKRAMRSMRSAKPAAEN